MVQLFLIIAEIFGAGDTSGQSKDLIVLHSYINIGNTVVIGVGIHTIRLIVLSCEQLAAIVKQPVSQRHIAVPVEAEEIGHGIPLGVEREVTGGHGRAAPFSLTCFIFVPADEGIAGAFGIRHVRRNLCAVIDASVVGGAALVQRHAVAQLKRQHVLATGVVDIRDILCAVGFEGD